jgi:hypothetical protein
VLQVENPDELDCLTVNKVICPTEPYHCVKEYWCRGKVIWERKPEKMIDIRGKEYSEDTIVAALKNHCPE